MCVQGASHQPTLGVCAVVSAVGGSSPALAFLSCRHRRCITLKAAHRQCAPAPPLPPSPFLQEPDAARTQAEDKSSDPDFGASKEEMRAADTAAAEEPGAGECLGGTGGPAVNAPGGLAVGAGVFSRMAG